LGHINIAVKRLQHVLGKSAVLFYYQSGLNPIWYGKDNERSLVIEAIFVTVKFLRVTE